MLVRAASFLLFWWVFFSRAYSESTSCSTTIASKSFDSSMATPIQSNFGFNDHNIFFITWTSISIFFICSKLINNNHNSLKIIQKMILKFLFVKIKIQLLLFEGEFSLPFLLLYRSFGVVFKFLFILYSSSNYLKSDFIHALIDIEQRLFIFPSQTVKLIPQLLWNSSSYITDLL